MIKLKTYTINNSLLTNELLSAYINLFWKEVFEQLTKGPSVQHLMLMCKVEFKEGEVGYRTIGDLRRVNYEDKELFVEYLINRLGLLNESYTSHPISNLTFSYIIKSGLATDNRRLLQDVSDKSLSTHRFNNLNLPNSMNPSDYGTIMVDNIIKLNGESIHRFNVVNGNRSYLIDVSNNGLVNNVRIQGAIDLKWIDTKISEGIFMREIGKSVIYFMGGEKVLRKKMLSAKPFTKVATDKTLNNNFVTMDIETIKINNNITPYLICGYNGTDFISTYADKALNQDELFSSFITQLITFFAKGGNTLTVYAHNFSNFDGVFLFNQLLQFGKLSPYLILSIVTTN